MGKIQELNQWCNLIAIVSVISAVLLLIIPHSKTKKSFEALLTLILVMSMISPFAQDGFNLNILSADINKLDDKEIIKNAEALNPLLYVVETESSSYIEKACSDAGFDCKCVVKCKYVDGNLIIAQVNLNGKLNKNEKSTAEEIILSICNRETVIIFEDDEYG